MPYHHEATSLDRLRAGRIFSTAKSRTALERASEKQEELAEARVTLLVRREKARTSARLVRSQRDNTRNATAAFMDLVREFDNQHHSQFSSALQLACEKVQDANDKLGAMEEDQAQAERSLGGLEWQFMERENEFYGFELSDLFENEDRDLEEQVADQLEVASPIQLSRPTPISNSIVEYQSALAEFERLKKQFDALRPKQARRDPIDTSLNPDNPAANPSSPATPTFENIYSDLIMRISEWEVRVEHLRKDLMEHESLLTLRYRRNSDPYHQVGGSTSPFNTSSRRYSEGDFPAVLENPPAKHRIRDWLLDCLRKNAIEKTRYLSILEESLAKVGIYRPNLSTWEANAIKFWSLDATEDLFEPTMNEISVASYDGQVELSNLDSDSWKRLSKSTPIIDERETLADEETGNNLIADLKISTRSSPSVYVLDHDSQAARYSPVSLLDLTSSSTCNNEQQQINHRPTDVQDGYHDASNAAKLQQLSPIIQVSTTETPDPPEQALIFHSGDRMEDHLIAPTPVRVDSCQNSDVSALETSLSGDILRSARVNPVFPLEHNEAEPEAHTSDMESTQTFEPEPVTMAMPPDPDDLIPTYDSELAEDFPAFLNLDEPVQNTEDVGTRNTSDWQDREKTSVQKPKRSLHTSIDSSTPTMPIVDDSRAGRHFPGLFGGRESPFEHTRSRSTPNIPAGSVLPRSYDTTPNSTSDLAYTLRDI